MRVKMRAKIAKLSWGDTDLQTSQMYLEETVLACLHLALLRLFWINNYIFIIIDQCGSFYFWEKPWYSHKYAWRLHYIPCLGSLGFVWFFILSKNKVILFGAQLKISTSFPSMEEFCLDIQKYLTYKQRLNSPKITKTHWKLVST